MAKPHRTFVTAAAFRTSLEERLSRTALRESVDLQRLRRQVAFDRLLARLLVPARDWWVLKGGYALELRIKLARATRDIDLVRRRAETGEGKDEILAKLQDAAEADLKDFFVFRIGQPTKDLLGAPYGGARYPVEAVMDGRRFASFHLDVATGDSVMEPLDWIVEKDWLDFAGIAPAKLPAISKEQHFAEKLHAFTLPRKGGENTRVRDLVDMILLADRFKLDKERLHDAVVETFSRRKTHVLPKSLPQPPASWKRPFSGMAGECGITFDIEEAFRYLRDYCRKAGL